jgi:hypothetical protein
VVAVVVEQKGQTLAGQNGGSGGGVVKLWFELEELPAQPDKEIMAALSTIGAPYGQAVEAVRVPLERECLMLEIQVVAWWRRYCL